MASFPSVAPILILAFLLVSFSEAREFQVGGSAESWKIPFPSNVLLNQWAKHQLFRINDSLIWKYDNKSETVLQVDEEDYKSCHLSDPMQEYSDGDTKVVLDHSGPFYFISGIKGHSQKGLKLVVVVMSNSHRTNRDSSTPTPTPTPAPEPSPSTFALPPDVGAAASCFGGGFMRIVMGMGVLLAMV